MTSTSPLTSAPESPEALLALWNKHQNLRKTDAPIAERADAYFAMKEMQVKVLAASHTA